MAEENETQEEDAPEGEQSMDEILGSIRDILSDDEENAQGQDQAESADAGDVLESQNQVAGEGPQEMAAVVSPPQENGIEAATEPEPEGDPEPEPDGEGDDARIEESASDTAPEGPSQNTESQDDPTLSPSVSDTDGEDYLELTEQMIAPAASDVGAGAAILSGSTQTASTDPLQELAKALLNRRDIAIGNRDMTLEGLIREIIRPLLREWLDENLPYLIERLVKKEIDHMVNRAERLDL